MTRCDREVDRSIPSGPVLGPVDEDARDREDPKEAAAEPVGADDDRDREAQSAR
jgi:hypothetical protein